MAHYNIVNKSLGFKMTTSSAILMKGVYMIRIFGFINSTDVGKLIWPR